MTDELRAEKFLDTCMAPPIWFARLSDRVSNKKTRILFLLTVGAMATPVVFGSGFFPGEILVGGRPGYSFEFGPGYVQAYSFTGTYQRDAATLPFGHPRD